MYTFTKFGVFVYASFVNDLHNEGNVVRQDERYMNLAESRNEEGLTYAP